MSLPVVTAADGAEWERLLLTRLAAAPADLTVVRRCVDVVELAAVAASGQATVAMVDVRLRRLDADLVLRLSAGGVAVVGVVRDEAADVELLRAAGIDYAVSAHAEPAVYGQVAREAVAAIRTAGSMDRSFADVGARPGLDGELAEPLGADIPPMRSPVTTFSAEPPASRHDGGDRGAVIAVWGPAGAPGRTTVAVNLATELGLLGAHCLLIDADPYGGVIANVLGLLDESPGLVAACRQALADRLDLDALTSSCWQLSPSLRVLSGLVRADRWPELRPAALGQVLALSRELAESVVVDVGFCLETDEELSFDTIAPRRNGATLAVLEAADLILAVGTADPVGMQRLIRGLDELRELQLTAPVWVILNRVRGSSVPGKPAVELDAALQRFAGRSAAALLPFDQDGLDQALVAGRSLAEAAPGSPLRSALTDLAAAASGRPAPPRGRRRPVPARRG